MPDQKTDIDFPEVLAHSPGFLFNRAARIVSVLIGETLAPFGLVPQEYGLLRIISVSGPIMQQDFADQYNIDRTTVTDIVDGLEARELLTRLRSSEDRRRNMLHLTPSGRKLLSRASRMVNKKQKEFLAPLTEEEWEFMRSSLIKLLVANPSGSK